MKSAEIREAFLQYFESKGHSRVASSSLVPGNDPTLLFTNAGMVQFKDVFLGQDNRSYSRATSSQRCVRAGGKHNDLENVGYTARHHTFFEMLGNFSFGDYFKKDAINYAWEFLTSKEWLAIPTEKLCVTVYADDDEAYGIWANDVGVPEDRIIRIGDNKGGRYNSDNFWAMGDTGPCGPCTEIFYDHGEHIWGGRPGTPEEDGDRFIEIWNVVFMQFNRSADGEMAPLPKPSVDTGMGLERIAAVMQHVHSNYEIDLFQALLEAAAQATQAEDKDAKSLRVIADHIRSCAFLVSDGVLPSNEGRGYVLRRIIRRAVRHGNKLGQTKPFFHTLVAALVEQMGEAYPELVRDQASIEKVLAAEEDQFAKTLEKGMVVLENALAELKGTVIPGEVIFTLYDTYGFPVDLTNDIARERELTLDMDGYDALMEQQKKRARESGSFKVDYSATATIEGQTNFVGYSELTGDASVTAILVDGQNVESLTEGQSGVIVLDTTPFYGESGGQAGDTGYIVFDGAKFEVQDCQKSGANHLHVGQLLAGSVKVGDKAQPVVDSAVRQATALNHSATHLLHAALRKVLGEHVTQKGSLVDSERLRFDFSHFEAVKPEELKQIENMVNEQIRLNSPVETELCDMEAAQQKGAMALFGEKYGDEVRVLSMGGAFSVELCGGTHVSRTGDIGLIRITSESGIASGVRRIEAVTGEKALSVIDASAETLNAAAKLLKASPENLLDKVEQLIAQNRQLEKSLAAAKSKLASSSADEWLSEATDIAGVKVLAKAVEGVDAKSLRDMMDKLKNKLGTSAVILASVNDDKISLVAGVSQDATSKIKAGDMVKHVAGLIGGKGGGRPDMAQGGGTDVEALPAAIGSVLDWAKGVIG